MGGEGELLTLMVVKRPTKCEPRVIDTTLSTGFCRHPEIIALTGQERVVNFEI